MVLKPMEWDFDGEYQFESDVISDGTQTLLGAYKVSATFESDVISDGTQTKQCE